MQVAVIEFARNVLKLDADSTEFKKNTQHPVIGLITEWLDEDGLIQYRTEDSDKGGTMRLGSQVCHLKKNSKMAKLYKNSKFLNATDIDMNLMAIMSRHLIKMV